MDSSLLFLGTLLAAIFIGGALTSDDRAAANESIAVLSANVRYGSANDGQHAWKHRADLTVRTIVEAEPSILGLQEALDFQVEAIADALPRHVVIGEGRDGGSKGEWCALLVDTSRFTIRASGTFRLSPKDEVGAMGWDAACTRIATWAELADRKENGAAFLVINTHFDHEGKEARRKSAELLVSWGKRRQKSRGPLPVLLLGDLNAVETSPALEMLKGAGLRDTFRLHRGETEEIGTFHGFKGGRDGRRIDYCLASDAWLFDDAWIDWTEKDGRYPSDHRFVGAHVSLSR